MLNNFRKLTLLPCQIYFKFSKLFDKKLSRKYFTDSLNDVESVVISRAQRLVKYSAKHSIGLSIEGLLNTSSLNVKDLMDENIMLRKTMKYIYI